MEANSENKKGEGGIAGKEELNGSRKKNRGYDTENETAKYTRKNKGGKEKAKEKG